MENWIKVSDRLPDHGYDILVTDGDACMVANYDNIYSSFVFTNLEYWDNEDVTHWMPLPEPPKD